MGAMAACGALCYGELAARFPEAGGGYVYLREAYGRPLAFLYGWMAFLVMDPGLSAALALGMAGYVSYMVHLSPLATKLLAVGTIAALAAVNMRGVRLGGSLLRWLTVLKLALLILLVLWGFGFQLGSWSNFVPLVAQRPQSAPLFGALAGGLVAAFFSFGGWWDAAKLAGEVRDAERVMPRALLFGVIAVTLVYLLTSAVFIYLVPMESVTSGDAFAAQAGEVLFGQAGGEIFSGIVVIAVLGSLSTIIMSAPRVYFAMARDGLFVPGVARLHPRFGTPVRAIILQAILASLLVMVGRFNEIISYFIFVVVIFLGLTVAALFLLRNRPETSPFRTPGYPLTPLAFLLLIAVMLFLLAANNPLQSFLGVGVVLLGVPVYYLLY
jgi:APA family basic amino acid/polyamine antiporter